MCRAINNGVSFHSHPQITAKVHILVFSGASSNTWNISSMWCHSMCSPTCKPFKYSNVVSATCPSAASISLSFVAFGQNLLVLKLPMALFLPCSALILSEGSASVIPENLPEECFFSKGLILEIKLMHVVEYTFHPIDILI